MKLLFENWRKYLNEEEEALLVEGRKEDAKKTVAKNIKYDQIAKQLEGLLDPIIEADPSGNQKYLGWAARILNLIAKDSIRRIEELGEWDLFNCYTRQYRILRGKNSNYLTHIPQICFKELD
jgi:hypothetical protein